jgi:hypothetical protein
MTMARQPIATHRNTMVGFCPRADEEVISSMAAEGRSLLLPLELANPSAENSRPTPGGRHSRKTGWCQAAQSSRDTHH